MAAVTDKVSSAAAANYKKKLDEQHLKLLRELAALAHNKHCFDCNQRGPTYVNMTIGSFVCTSCSGLLRGLNPPHRVKSISMASFTADEIEMLQSRGNAFCKKVWLGLHDGRLPLAADARDEVKMRELMTQRYEKRRWYVHPTPDMYEEAKKQNTPEMPPSVTAAHVRTSMQVIDMQKSLPSGTASPVVSQPMQQSSFGGSTLVTVNSLMSTATPPCAAVVSAVATSNSTTTTVTKFDLLAEFGGDPFASGLSSNTAAQPALANGFANFDMFNSGSTGGATLVSSSNFATNFTSSTSSTSSMGPPPVPADKYSALVELESAFSAPTSAAPISWDGTSGLGARGGTAANWGSAAPPAGPRGSVFSSSGIGTSTGSSSFMYHGGGGVPAAVSSSSFNMVPASMGTAAGFAAPGGANPFGDQRSHQMQNPSHHHPQQPVANPFMVGVGYGQPTTGSLGQVQFGAAPTYGAQQFGAIPSSAAGGFQFGGTAAMGQAAGMMNGGGGGAGGMWSMQPSAAATVGQVPQQFATTWGQPQTAAANPFLGIGGVSGFQTNRGSNVSNPFL
jgi:Arf-GAP domain and FG repeat-containing protein 1